LLLSGLGAVPEEGFGHFVSGKDKLDAKLVKCQVTRCSEPGHLGRHQNHAEFGGRIVRQFISPCRCDRTASTRGCCNPGSFRAWFRRGLIGWQYFIMMNGPSWSWAWEVSQIRGNNRCKLFSWTRSTDGRRGTNFTYSCSDVIEWVAFGSSADNNLCERIRSSTVRNGL